MYGVMHDHCPWQREKNLLLKTYEVVKQTILAHRCDKKYCATILYIKCSTK